MCVKRQIRVVQQLSRQGQIIALAAYSLDALAKLVVQGRRPSGGQQDGLPVGVVPVMTHGLAWTFSIAWRSRSRCCSHCSREAQNFFAPIRLPVTTIFWQTQSSSDAAFGFVLLLAAVLSLAAAAAGSNPDPRRQIATAIYAFRMPKLQYLALCRSATAAAKTTLGLSLLDSLAILTPRVVPLSASHAHFSVGEAAAEHFLLFTYDLIWVATRDRLGRSLRLLLRLRGNADGSCRKRRGKKGREQSFQHFLRHQAARLAEAAG